MKKFFSILKKYAYYSYLIVAIALLGASLYLVIHPRLKIHQAGFDDLTQLFYLYIAVAIVNLIYFIYYVRKRRSVNIGKIIKGKDK